MSTYPSCGTYVAPTAFIPMTPPCEESPSVLSPAAIDAVMRAARADRLSASGIEGWPITLAPALALVPSHTRMDHGGKDA